MGSCHWLLQLLLQRLRVKQQPLYFPVALWSMLLIGHAIMTLFWSIEPVNLHSVLQYLFVRLSPLRVLCVVGTSLLER